ncbi:lyase family protein [Streptomyces sp. NPDC059122]|uniref:lyase family protein n=1 Tax=Streptomyces sp. NPDC059122 TaxID=3346732 RepID=UPI0036BF22A9
MARHATTKIRDIPIGLHATGTRRETDSMGAIDVPADRNWGAQTQRSLIHFSIGDDRMPKADYRAYGYVKKAAASVNGRAGRLPAWKSDLIQRVADEVIAGELDDHFPLYVWQTGSGRQSNMNTNEVISNRAIQLAGGELGSKSPIHPNDHVNTGQSSNDTFPTAMHIAAVKEIHEHLLPSVQALQHAIENKARQWHDVVKIGRTHLEDAVPLTVGQEWSGYAHQLQQAIDRVTSAAAGLYELAMGGTAVGTGLNAPPGFGEEVAAEIADATGYPFTTARNKFAAQGGLDAMAGAGCYATAHPGTRLRTERTSARISHPDCAERSSVPRPEARVLNSDSHPSSRWRIKPPFCDPGCSDLHALPVAPPAPLAVVLRPTRHEGRDLVVALHGVGRRHDGAEVLVGSAVAVLHEATPVLREVDLDVVLLRIAAVGAFHDEERECQIQFTEQVVEGFRGGVVVDGPGGGVGAGGGHAAPSGRSTDCSASVTRSSPVVRLDPSGPCTVRSSPHSAR